MLDIETCTKAFHDRDPAYDGVFFIAVKTTKIYCRPVCKVKQPLDKNVTFLQSAAACEDAGYRPCLRCRPETAPFSPAWNGTKTTVSRALKLIEDGGLDNTDIETFAAKLGIGARHLTRLFQTHLGTTPSRVAKTVRVQKAKRLLDETDLPISEIAVKAGFKSPRRFNAVFKETYRRSPSTLRRPPSA